MRAKALLEIPEKNAFAEPETLTWINGFAEGATMLDIGANVGSFSIYAAVVKKTKVYSFEPSGSNFFVLNKNVGLNNLHDLVLTFPIALSDENKIDFLYMPNLNIGGSGNTAGEDRDWLLQRRTSQVKQGTVIASVDRLIQEQVIKPPEYIKVDVDGIEPRIVRGAGNLLSSGHVISILIELSDHLPEHRDAINLLTKHGYSYNPDETERNRVRDPAWRGLCNYIFRHTSK